MIKYISATIILFISTISFSQKIIELNTRKVNFENRKFYVSKVIDKREIKDFIGEYQNDSIIEKITLKGGVLKNIGDYCQMNLTKTSNEQIPIIIYINLLKINKTTKTDTIGNAEVVLTFIKENGDSKIINSIITKKSDSIYTTHNKRIKEALFDCFARYNKTINLEEYEVISDEDAIEINFETKDTSSKEYKKDPNSYKKRELENVTTAGYLIGGMNLLGIDYERRITKIIGIHAGGGVFGYTAGIKIHTKAAQNSLFLNLSWKDKGFGLMTGIAAEAGSRWIWSKKRNFGLLYQGGIIVFNHIDDNFSKVYLDGEKPTISIMIGIGLSW